jgi:hypothetical protein
MVAHRHCNHFLKRAEIRIEPPKRQNRQENYLEISYLSALSILSINGCARWVTLAFTVKNP